MFKHYLLLYLVHQIQGERSLSGLFHLLKGKRSSQSIQDSYLFHLEPFFQSMDSLQRPAFDALTQECMENGWIQITQADQKIGCLTASGREVLQVLERKFSFPDGLKYTNHVRGEKSFWLRIQLTVQTLSELVHGNNGFLPITRLPSVTEDVRQFLQGTPLSTQMLAEGLYNELSMILSAGPGSEAEIFTAQLTGFQTGGLTLRQLARKTYSDPFACALLNKSAIRRLMESLNQMPEDFPIMTGLLQKRSGSLSKSAEQTYRYLKKGLTIDALSGRRGLSVGTIEDHIIELALKIPGFDSSLYLPEHTKQLIINTAHQLETRKLKPIKIVLKDQASYFQIRLALAENAASERGR